MNKTAYAADRDTLEDVNWDDRACAAYPNLFASQSLSYTPNGEDFAHLNDHEHAEMAVKRERAEATAVNVCMGCPLLFACEKQVLKEEVYGVAAGMTADERRALSPTAVTAEPSIDIRDRSWRNRVNDEAVSLFTRQGWTNEQIAQELECTSRTVARSRARMRDNLEPVTIERIITAVPYIPASTKPTSRVSESMQAIYAILADGNFHDREELLNAATPLVPTAEALAWYDRKNPNDTTTPVPTRITKGARAKVDNALAASARNRARTERDPNNNRMYRATNKTPIKVVRTAA